MNGLQARKEEVAYLGQLERMLVKKLRRTDTEEVPLHKSAVGNHLNQVSMEINEELDRLERLILEEESQTAN